MKIHPTLVIDLVVVETNVFNDERGAFSRLFCEKELLQILAHRKIVQINHSCTKTVGAVRGLHFQRSPHAEMKLVRCLKGRVFDVAVDLRLNSPTYMHWYSQELSPENNLMMIIPEGFAHGFQVLEPSSELIYLHTEFYNPDSEGGLLHDDPKLGINWPLNVTELSERDRGHPCIDSNFIGISL
jgi:dTDP-4-dehydrorhamnose 3,5-epimerase